jgi:hypothetical protein
MDFLLAWLNVSGRIGEGSAVMQPPPIVNKTERH